MWGLTHIHLDHGGGAWKMIEAHPEADVYAHPKAVEHLVDPSRLVASAKQFFGPAFDKYGEVKGVNPMKIQESKDGEVLDLQGATLKVIWTPGHASHGQSYWEPDYRIIILGDSGGSFSKRTGNNFPITPPPFNTDQGAEDARQAHRPPPRDRLLQPLRLRLRRREEAEVLQGGASDVERGRRERSQGGTGPQRHLGALKEQDPILRLSLDEDDSRRRTAMPNIIGLMEYTKWKLKEEAKSK